MDSSFYQPYQLKRNSIRNYLLFSDQLDYQYDCLELENDQWASTSIMKGFPQYIKIRIQDYFPLKIFFNVGAFKCNIYFSFLTSQPSQKNHQKHVVIKQQKIIVIKKPEEHKNYLFFSLLSDYSTSIKLKAWFQTSQYDRSYFLCYDGREQLRMRSGSQNNNNTEDESFNTNKNISFNMQSVGKSLINESVPPIRVFSDNRRINSVKQRCDQVSLKNKILLAQQKKLQLLSQNVIQKYQRMLVQSYKQLNQQRMMKKYINQWIIVLNFLKYIDTLYAHFKINKILRCMNNSPKHYAQRWKYVHEKTTSLNLRVLMQANLTLSIFSNKLSDKISRQISDLILITLNDTFFIKTQAQLQQSFMNFYLKVRQIQQFYIAQRNKFYLQMEQMIQNIRQRSPQILISKQRMKRIIFLFYEKLCAKHKVEYKRFLELEVPNVIILTSVFVIFSKPKLNIMKNEALLLQIIQQTE
ncbi:unnamed protein product (macronuclear) [Paramecium tetraurelia]|uniref:Uncharacterized protein n=1 Tax=Paramecium tetraurelia TaxID=5888 RepID=A0C9V5_PARTE|nr:uncharacterized protein GSPATT00006879001 [Paramecium tetraurelia]CAK67572.1 unnamed protein product [Paramecium tetraurelia]|eukprot:XP_001434969.1 hypothetical protein (macronuclear) [Paramecium tetraurelia strain d4-2]